VIDVVDEPTVDNWEWDVPDSLIAKWEKVSREYGSTERAIFDYVAKNPECQNLVLVEQRLQEKREKAERDAEAQKLYKRFTKVMKGLFVFIVFLAIILGLLASGVI